MELVDTILLLSNLVIPTIAGNVTEAFQPVHSNKRRIRFRQNRVDKPIATPLDCTVTEGNARVGRRTDNTGRRTSARGVWQRQDQTQQQFFEVRQVHSGQL